MAASSASVSIAIPKYGKKAVDHVTPPSLLVALLGRPLADSAKQPAVRNKVYEVLQELATNATPIFIPVLHTEKSEFGAEGTLTDIYKVARKSRDMQWPSILVLDELTDRQLKGEARVGEVNGVTAIVVHLKPASEDERPGPSTFFVRRLLLRAAIKEALDDNLKDWRELGKGGQSRDFRPSGLEPGGLPFTGDLYEKGLYLSHPLGSIFTDDDSFQDLAIRTSIKALEAEPFLPPEIKQRIESFVEQDIPLEDLTTAPAKLDPKPGRLDVMSLVDITPNQLNEAHKVLKDAAQQANNAGSIKWEGEIFIHKWKIHSPANRRDITRLFKRYLDSNDTGANQYFFAMCTFLIDVPTPKKHNLVLAQWYFDNPILLRRSSLTECLQSWGERFEDEDDWTMFGDLIADEELPDGQSEEQLLDPLAPIPPDLPPWLPAIGTNPREPGPIMHYLTSVSAVFYLTRNLDEEQNQAVLDELYCRRDRDDGSPDPRIRDKIYCFVPWENDVDGGPEDMWALLKKRHDFRGGRSRRGLTIFIDQHSPHDGQVLVAYLRYDPIRKHWAGMYYGRLQGRKARSACADYDSRFILMDKLVAEVCFYRDPDYAGPTEEEAARM
ncbi:MAG: hypothetical protein Q9165_001299 [Trypethelium subeluteriae]